MPDPQNPMTLAAFERLALSGTWDGALKRQQVIELLQDIYSNPAHVDTLRQRGVYVHKANGWIRFVLVDGHTPDGQPMRVCMNYSMRNADRSLLTRNGTRLYSDRQPGIQTPHDHGKKVRSIRWAGTALTTQLKVVGLVLGAHEEPDDRIKTELQDRYSDRPVFHAFTSEEAQQIVANRRPYDPGIPWMGGDLQILDVYVNEPGGGSSEENLTCIGQALLQIEGWAVASEWETSPHTIHQAIDIIDEPGLTFFINAGVAHPPHALVFAPPDEELSDENNLFNSAEIKFALGLAIHDTTHHFDPAEPHEIRRAIADVIGISGPAGVLTRMVTNAANNIIQPPPISNRKIDIQSRTDGAANALRVNTLLPSIRLQVMNSVSPWL